MLQVTIDCQVLGLKFSVPDFQEVPETSYSGVVCSSTSVEACLKLLIQRITESFFERANSYLQRLRGRDSKYILKARFVHRLNIFHKSVFRILTVKRHRCLVRKPSITEVFACLAAIFWPYNLAKKINSTVS